MDSEQSVKILLVDDRKENLMALKAILDDPEYELVDVRSGSQALKQVLVDEFALILLDVQMPGLDGFETAALIRRRERSRHIPIIFITAISKDEHYVYRGYSLGAVDYIFKPFEPEVLRAKVAVFVELFKKTQKIQLQAALLRQSEQRERERKLAELKQKSDQRYRNLADAIPQIVWTARPDGSIEYFNQRWFDYTGLTVEQARGGAWRDVLYPDDVAYGEDSWNEAMRTGKAVSCELRLRGKDGQYCWHLVQVLAERNIEGTIVAWLGTATNIDEQKRIEQALGAEKERLVVTLRSIDDGVLTIDTDHRVVLINRAAEVMTGWEQARVLGQPLHRVLNIRNEGAAEKLVARVLKSGEPAKTKTDKPMVVVDRQGTERLVVMTGAPLRARDETLLGVVLVLRDVTDHQRLEEERLKASRLESIGLLAGAIAHDFNNILTAIMGNISLAKLYTRAEDNIMERLLEAEKAALWAKDLTQQLLTFAKGGAPMKRIVDASILIKDAAQFACRGSHVRCKFSLPEDLWTIEVDEGQIRQVIHNLVINAQQAMPEGGEVELHAQNINVTPEHKLPLSPGEYLKISCSDRGVGIPHEHLAKIFDPYFTTKPKGSGLGLATAYSIITKHEGLIAVESKPGKGTTFDIYLPASGKPVPLVVSDPKQIAAAPAHGRILVMDDETFIRDLLGRLFTHFGYQVELARDGAEALSLYRQAQASGRPFDVVIMDLVIPGGMGGRETMEKLLGLDPNARVIVSSGYSNDPIMADYRKYGFREAVAKPYKNEELRDVVQKVMHG